MSKSFTLCSIKREVTVHHNFLLSQKWLDDNFMVGWLKCEWNKFRGALLKWCGLWVLHQFCDQTMDEILKLSLQRNGHWYCADIDIVTPVEMISQLQDIDVVVNNPSTPTK